MKPATVALALGLFAPGASAWAGDAPSSAPPSARGTDIALHTKEPIRPGRNALWCATVQLAWDALADSLAAGKPLTLGPPAPEADVAEMNRRAFPHTDLDEASYVAIGGFGRDGVLERISKAVRSKFPGQREMGLIVGPDDALGYARLIKDLPFETQFHVLPKVVAFAEGPPRVRAFGMFADEGSEAAFAMLKQVALYAPPDAPEHTYGPWFGVTELVPKGGADRIYLQAPASVPATLEDGWRAMAAVLSKGRNIQLDVSPDLVIPRIRLDVEKSFDSLLGAQVEGSSRLAVAYQRTQFSLDERGARLDSEAAFACAIVPKAVYDRPFLLALRRQGATRPYLLLWIANDDLLDKAEAKPLEKATLAPYLGSWTFDSEKTIDEFVTEAAQGAPAHLTPTQAREAARKKGTERFEGFRSTIEIAQDGTATVTVASEDGLEALGIGDRGPLRGSLRILDGKTVLWPEAVGGSPVSDRERIPFDVTLAAGRLRVAFPGDRTGLTYRRS